MNSLDTLQFNILDDRIKNSFENRQPQIKITYQFPPNIQQFRRISSFQEWQKKYESIKQMPSGCIQPPRYKIQTRSGNNKSGATINKIYIYCTFYRCTSSFTYYYQPPTQDSEGYYHLQYYKLKHDHSKQEQDKRNKIKSKTKKILSEYIKQTLTNNPTLPFREIKKHFSSKLSIQNQNLRYHYDLAKIHVKELNKKKQLYQGIQKNKLIFLCDRFEQWQDQKFRFMVTCEQMIKSYEKWFKVTYLSIHIAESFDESDSTIFLGSLSGINGNLESVPFALFLVKLNVQSISLLIKDFFSKIVSLGKFQEQPGTSQKNWLPSTLIMTYFSFSDQLHKTLLSKQFCLIKNLSQGVQSSFKNMTFIHEGQSFLNKFKSDKISDYMMNLSEEKFVKLILEPEKIRFNEWIEKDLEKVGYNFSIEDGQTTPYEQFLQQSEKVCLSQFKEGTFIGTYLLQESKLKVLQLECARLLSNFLSNYLKTRDSGFVDKFYSCVSEARQRTQKLQLITETNHQIDNYEDVLKIPEMAKISFVVQKKIFRLIIEKIMLTICLKTFKSNASLILVYVNSNPDHLLQEYEKLSKNPTYYELMQNKLDTSHISVLKAHREYFYQVYYDGKQSRWTCECGHFALRGLPCEHQLAVCIRYNYSIEKQISAYWMRNDERVVFWNHSKKRGRPRMTEV